MKKIILFICLAWQVLALHAQTFEVKDSIYLDSTRIMSFRSLDLNNDALTDLLMVLQSGGQYQMIFKEGEADNVDTLQLGSITIPLFHVADLDNNTRLDIIFHGLLSGDTVLMVSYQEDVLQFSSPVLIDSLTYQKMDVLDIDSDGFKELIYSDKEGKLHVKRSDSISWVDFNSDIDFDVEEWMLLDKNNNGLADLIRTHGGKVFCHPWVDNKWSDEDSVIFEGDIRHLSHGDVDRDGVNDIAMYGTKNQTDYYLWAVTDSTTFEIPQPELISQEVYMHDFTTDGAADILIAGLKGDSTSYLDLFVNTQGVWGSDSSDYDISFNQLIVNDLDYDGDLDLVASSELSEIKILDNITEEKNIGPSVVTNHFAFVNGRRVIIRWDGASDDFTDSLSLTYDVAIGDDLTNAKYLGPNFDLSNFYRLYSSKGNSGLKNEIGINRDFDNGLYFYCIQSIDNALYFLGNGAGPPVAVGQFVICEENVAETKYACEDEVIEIITESPVAYYSELKGYLGLTDTLIYEVSEPDLIMTGQQGAVDCSAQKSYKIEILDTSDLLEQGFITSCIGDEVIVSIEDQFDSVQWYFNGNLVSESPDYQFTASENGLIKLNVSRGTCMQADSLELILGNPVIKMPVTLTIFKGESVVLNATANNYETVKWTPAAGLDDDEVLSPMASPLTTTSYQLTVEDSLGCVAQGTVQVIVIEQGWIPDLFTPNDDGNNDNLLIYGLEDATEVRLEIFNRSGNKVFEDSNLQNLKQKGWDGTSSGQKQPNGLYFWKVTGRNADGNELKLNGKTDGVVYLMR
ncbi:gliding motility-associated C-terminal domain-containing protein [Fulvivirga sp.]|uniref:gliding motility-associated C-terminal domain-containing protein n=1 Tax=Fulvivirga sp. TaxID=1931237 RepID=UPI0032EC2114